MNIKEIVNRAISDMPSPPLSTEEIKFMAKYIYDQSKQIWCDHNNKQKTQWGSSVCADCNKSLGWYCETSPDKVCHYFTEETLSPIHRKVLGTKFQIKVPGNYDSDLESTDCCIYCGRPGERK